MFQTCIYTSNFLFRRKEENIKCLMVKEVLRTKMSSFQPKTKFLSIGFQRHWKLIKTKAISFKIALQVRMQFYKVVNEFIIDIIAMERLMKLLQFCLEESKMSQSLCTVWYLKFLSSSFNVRSINVRLTDKSLLVFSKSQFSALQICLTW